MCRHAEAEPKPSLSSGCLPSTAACSVFLRRIRAKADAAIWRRRCTYGCCGSAMSGESAIPFTTFIR